MHDQKLSAGLVAFALTCLAGCGQKGPLYLPEPAKDIVTRPVATPPPAESTAAPDSPQTTDSPAAPASPAPEVTAPGRKPADAAKKDKNGATTQK